MSAPDATFADFNDCLVLNTIRTARAITRRYDNYLATYHVTVVQFSVMVHIRQFQGSTIQDLANRMAMDRSTLSRNMDILIRNGFVEKAQTGKGNARNCHLTAAGNALLDQLMPKWLAGRDDLLNKLGDVDPMTFLSALHRLAAT